MLPQVDRKLGLISFNNINAAPGHEVDPRTRISVYITEPDSHDS